MRRDGLPVDLDHLEVVHVDVERVPVLTSVAQSPLFCGAELDGLIDPILVKLAAIDEVSKRRQLLRESELAVAVDRCSTQILKVDQCGGQRFGGYGRTGTDECCDGEVLLCLEL